MLCPALAVDRTSLPRALRTALLRGSTSRAAARCGVPGRRLRSVPGQAYAADKPVLATWTRPLVRVVGFDLDDDDDRPRPVLTAADAYNAFDVTFRDGAFHEVAATERGMTV